ncbi:hypothetical protein MED222_05305 [Vibrio sp. MED222]|nr:hypothetical protein MED222_05305 [Vibrio sp. MED222]
MHIKCNDDKVCKIKKTNHLARLHVSFYLLG